MAVHPLRGIADRSLNGRADIVCWRTRGCVGGACLWFSLFCLSSWCVPVGCGMLKSGSVLLFPALVAARRDVSKRKRAGWAVLTSSRIKGGGLWLTPSASTYYLSPLFSLLYQYPAAHATAYYILRHIPFGRRKVYLCLARGFGATACRFFSMQTCCPLRTAVLHVTLRTTFATRKHGAWVPYSAAPASAPVGRSLPLHAAFPAGWTVLSRDFPLPRQSYRAFGLLL